MREGGVGGRNEKKVVGVDRGERTEQERGEPDANVGKLWQVNGQ